VGSGVGWASALPPPAGTLTPGIAGPRPQQWRVQQWQSSGVARVLGGAAGWRVCEDSGSASLQPHSTTAATSPSLAPRLLRAARTPSSPRAMRLGARRPAQPAPPSRARPVARPAPAAAGKGRQAHQHATRAGAERLASFLAPDAHTPWPAARSAARRGTLCCRAATQTPADDENALTATPPAAASTSTADSGDDAPPIQPDRARDAGPRVLERALTSEGSVDYLAELIAVQAAGPRDIGFFGTRNMGFLHQNLIEILAYACVLTGNHVFTSGATGTNAAVVRGALRAEKPHLLTVVLPQSLSMQPPESRELLATVANVIEMPHNDSLPLAEASRACNTDIVGRVRQVICFAFHDSRLLLETCDEAKAQRRIVTLFYLD